MISPRNRYKSIYNWQRKILLVIATGIITLTSLSLTSQAINNWQAGNQAKVVTERNEFWQIVAQQKKPAASNVKNSFAITLRDKLGPQDDHATTLPTEIEEFRAGPNAFGGIETELGFVPFDNSGQQCVVCGSLNTDMKTKLLLIKQGKLSTVLGQEEATIGDTSWHFTPFGMNTLLWLGFVYTGSTVAALSLAIRHDSRKHNYRPGSLDWEYDGGSVADEYRRLCKQISPLYFVTVLPLQRKLSKDKTHTEILEMMGLDSSDTKLRAALNQLNSLPAEKQNELGVVEQRELIESLLDQIEQQVVSYTEGEDPSMAAIRSVDSIQALTREAAMVITSRALSLEELETQDAHQGIK